MKHYESLVTKDFIVFPENQRRMKANEIFPSIPTFHDSKKKNQTSESIVVFLFKINRNILKDDIKLFIQGAK